MTDILQAARSYYGLADTESCTTQLFTTQAGQICVAFEIPLSSYDFERIVVRMKALDEISSQEQADAAIIEGPTVEAMREAYNALSKAEKGRYGSFARYMADSSGGIIDAYTGEPYENLLKRQVIHVDAPEEPEPVSMDAVWMLGKECTDAQVRHSSDSRWAAGTFDVPEYLIQWAMLTDEQKQKAKESGK